MGWIIDPDGEAEIGTCADCGEKTRSVWGYVSSEESARAAYFIRWTAAHLERGAQIVICVGPWGEAAKADERLCFGFECRMGADRPGFKVVNAAELPGAQDDFLGQKLTRDQALRNPLSKEVFSILDALVDEDERFRGFLLSG